MDISHDTQPVVQPEVKPKKKRGRKPKNIISKQKITNTPPIQENLIVNVKSHKVTSSIEPYETTASVQQEITHTTNQKLCWNCCSRENVKYSIPLKYINGVYMMHGDFCSYQCGARYIHDTYDNSELWSRYNLLNMYYNEMMNTSGERVQMAPNKYLLQDFGGTMTHEEYHSRDTNDKIMVFPPMIPLDNTFVNVDSYKQSKMAGNLKLYRKNPIKKNQILQKLDASS